MKKARATIAVGTAVKKARATIYLSGPGVVATDALLFARMKRWRLSSHAVKNLEATGAFGFAPSQAQKKVNKKKK